MRSSFKIEEMGYRDAPHLNGYQKKKKHDTFYRISVMLACFNLHDPEPQVHQDNPQVLGVVECSLK